jgi:AcrR family transcriptional regulator
METLSLGSGRYFPEACWFELKCNTTTITFMSVEALVKLDRVYEPRQQRSRKTLERVLDALVELLAKKPFEEITMAELARRARIAVTSIYARFENKQALVLAAHERHRDEMIREIDQLLDPARWQGASLEIIVREVITRVIADRRSRLPLLRAALLINDPEVYERAAQISRHVSERMTILLSPHLDWPAKGERERTIDFALRAATSVLQQRLVFGEIEPARFRLSETELGRRLADQFLATLIIARPVARKATRKAAQPRSSRSKK